MPKSSYHHDNLQQNLIEAGIRLINQQGYDQFSLRKVAKACHVSHAAPYRHFKDKDELLGAMQSYVEERFSAILEKAISDSNHTDQSMQIFGKAYVTFFVNNPEYYPFLFSRETIHIEWSDGKIEETSNCQPYNIFCREMAKYFEAHQLPKEQQFIVLASMWSMVHGLAGLATTNSIYYEGNWEELTGKILERMNLNE